MCDGHMTSCCTHNGRCFVFRHGRCKLGSSGALLMASFFGSATSDLLPPDLSEASCDPSPRYIQSNEALFWKSENFCTNYGQSWHQVLTKPSLTCCLVANLFIYCSLFLALFFYISDLLCSLCILLWLVGVIGPSRAPHHRYVLLCGQTKQVLPAEDIVTSAVWSAPVVHMPEWVYFLFLEFSSSSWALLTRFLFFYNSADLSFSADWPLFFSHLGAGLRAP